MNPPKPAIHYDRVLGAAPAWRAAIMSALQGDSRPLRIETAMLERAGFHSGARMLTASFLYAYAGQQVYCLGPKLQRLLHETDLTAVPEAFLKLPYECIYVAFPDCPWTIWGGPRTKWHRIAGAYVSCMDSLLSIVVWGEENENSQHVGDDANFWMTLNLKRCRATGPDGAQVLDIESQVQSQLADYSADDSDPGMALGDTERGRVIEDIRSLARVVVNLVLYLNSTDPDTTVINEGGPINEDKQKKLRKAGRRKGKKATRARRKLKNLTEARVVWIGREIETGRAKKAGGTRKVGTRRPHWRKGHFHAYWVGSKKDADGNPRKGSHQVLKWLPPVLVGDMADMIRARGTIHMFEEDRK